MKWMVKRDGWRYPRCEMTVDGGDIVVKMKGYRRKAETFRIEGFRGKTALEALAEFDDGSAYGRWGMPFHDCLMDLYRDLGLDYGYTQSILREIGR